jgi:hypothetical protein
MFQQDSQDAERLVLNLKADSVFAQFARPHVHFKRAEADGSRWWAGSGYQSGDLPLSRIVPLPPSAKPCEPINPYLPIAWTDTKQRGKSYRPEIDALPPLLQRLPTTSVAAFREACWKRVTEGESR